MSTAADRWTPPGPEWILGAASGGGRPVADALLPRLRTARVLNVARERLLPPLLRRVHADSPEDEAAFWQHAATLTRQMGLAACLLMFVATVAWWPVDLLVFDDPEVRSGFGAMRTRVSVLLVAMFGALVVHRPRPVMTVALSVFGYGAVLVAFGYSLGAIGPGSLPWLADAFLGVVPTVLIPMPLRWRFPSVLVIGACLAAGYFAPFPDNLAEAGALAQLSYLCFAVLFSVAVGEAMTRITRRAWFERQALDVANARLAHLTETLSDRVAERTARLQALARHLDDVQERERRRLAHDLHDDLGQQLTAMRYTVARLEGRRASGADTEELTADLNAVLDGTTRSLRGVVTRLRPRILDDLGLAPAVEWLCEDVEQRSGVPCDVRIGVADAWARLPGAVELALFRVVQEATTNALKYAEPGRISVRLVCGPDVAVVRVEDDGVGFDPAATTDGFGLFGLRERVFHQGGHMRVTSSPGAGTTIEASIPLTAEAP